MRLLLILLIVPLIEIALFVQIGGAIGLFGTLAVVVATALLGAAMLRIQGLAILFDLKRAASGGGDIAGPILHGVMVFSSGLLLLTPGFFTYAVGFLLLVPNVRNALIRWGAQAVASQAAAQTWYPGRPDGGVIDGVAHDVSEDPPRRPGGPDS